METFVFLRELLAGVLTEGIENGELDATLDPGDTAAMIIAAMQGGYVLARGTGDATQFDRAMAGVLALLDRARKR
jgi:hypothetical protein